jgi:hypothetical protein
MPLASAAMLIANRLVPAATAERASWEIGVFCAVWILASLYAAIPAVRSRGWGHFFALNAIAFVLIPLVNLATAPQSHLFATIARGDWALASVDLTALGLSVAFAWLARRSFAKARQPAPARPARGRAVRDGAAINDTAVADH